jgi:hypothetical protein
MWRTVLFPIRVSEMTLRGSRSPPPQGMSAAELLPKRALTVEAHQLRSEQQPRLLR